MVSYKTVTAVFLSAAALAGSMMMSGTMSGSSPAKGPSPEKITNAATPQEEQIVPCQSFDTPPASPLTIRERRQEILGYSQQLEILKKNRAPLDAIQTVSYQRDVLLVHNILDRLLNELNSYTGLKDIKTKLNNNGKRLHDVCIYSLQSTPLPVILQTHPNGVAELDLNTVEEDASTLNDGHVLTQISERPLLDIEDELMPNIANQAVYYMTLYGTTSSENPAFSMSYELENLAMMWTVWRAAAAAEQMLHAADFHVRTGDIRSFDSSYNIQTYQHYLVSELSLQAMEHRKNGTIFSPQERKEFKHKAIREALKNPVIRLDGLLEILHETENSSGDERAGFFLHTLSAQEIADSLRRIDPDLSDMDPQAIYAVWDKKDDPARTIKAEILRLKKEATGSLAARPSNSAPAPAL